MLALAALTGCGSSSGLASREWWPTSAAWKAAASRAVRDPRTLVPAAGAAAIAAGGWDRQISDWAVRTTPIFSSPEDAGRGSDRLRAAAGVCMWVSALSVADGDRQWEKRLGRLAVSYAGGVVTGAVTGVVKDAVGRERPNSQDTTSFPSAHASRAFAYAAACGRNLDETALPGGWIAGLKTAATVVAGATAWARVEAGVHYPTDVLAGAALGNFLALAVHDAFLARPEAPVVGFALVPGGAAFTVSLHLE